MASDQRTVLLCGNSPYLLETFAGLALNDGWVPRVCKTLEALPGRLEAAPPQLTIVVVDLSVKTLDPTRVLKAVQSATTRLPVIAACPPGMPKQQLAELKAAGFAWLFDPETPEHELRFALKSLTSPPPPEHRKERRAPAAFTVAFWSASDEAREGTVTDLNEGGMFIETECGYSLGEVVTVAFDVPDSTTSIETQAEVVFNSPKLNRVSSLLPGNGLKFRELDPDAATAVRAYVSGMLKRMPGPANKALIGMRGPTT